MQQALHLSNILWIHLVWHKEQNIELKKNMKIIDGDIYVNIHLKTFPNIF